MPKRGSNANKAPAQKRAKRLNVKAALRDGSLLTGITLTGLQVTLHVTAAHNQTSDYKSANRALYELYQISPAFQASFESPKKGIKVPILQLKENHGYANEDAILAALKTFSSPQKRLNVKAALHDGSLLIGLTFAGLQVTLQLAAAYNQASYYKSINQALYDLYQISLVFQATFERPEKGASAPVLWLKSGHGYADENAILNALKAFAVPQKPLNVKAALKDGSLLTGVTLAGLQVTLHVVAAHSQASDYKSINHALYDLYLITPAFQAAFEQPKHGTQVPVLRLKENHGYASENAILSALKAFAASQKELNVRAALRDSSLLTGVTLAGLQVTLQLAAEYNQVSEYRSINKALYALYQISPAFQATFARPNTGVNAPVLQLKEGHGYVDESAILSALKAFAVPRKPLKIRAALKEGSLLTGVTLAGLKVTLHVAVAYNQVSDYKSINRALYCLYQESPAFQATFEQPKRGGIQAPVLRLKENHSYANEDAILTALTGFAQNKIAEPLSENASSEAIEIVESMPAIEEESSTISDTLQIEVFPQEISNFLINSSERELLALLGEQLSDNQQSYLEVATPLIPLTIENAPLPFQSLRDIELEANRVAQTVQEILGEDNDHDYDYDFEKNMRNYFLGKK